MAVDVKEASEYFLGYTTAQSEGQVPQRLHSRCREEEGGQPVGEEAAVARRRQALTRPRRQYLS